LLRKRPAGFSNGNYGATLTVRLSLALGGINFGKGNSLRQIPRPLAPELLAVIERLFVPAGLDCSGAAMEPESAEPIPA
jgi:hypothetical protein